MDRGAVLYGGPADGLVHEDSLGTRWLRVPLAKGIWAVASGHEIPEQMIYERVTGVMWQGKLVYVFIGMENETPDPRRQT